MIVFKCTFLLGLNTEAEEFKEKKNKTDEEKEHIHTDVENKMEYELRPTEFLKCLKIDYELLPRKFKYSIELTCWRNVAKLSNSETSHYYKTLKLGKLLWIPVTIHHFLKGLTEDELLNLHSHVINFNIASVNSPKKETTSKFSSLYCLESDAKADKFVEYFETDPNNKQGPHNDRIDEKDEYLKISNKCQTSDGIISWLRFTGKTHCYVAYETISSVKHGKDIKCKRFISSTEPSTEMNTTAKTKAKKQEEKKKDPYFIVPGEVFFTDPTLAVYKLKEQNKFLCLGYVLISVENLMTREQKTSLNPFIVKIKKLHCLPVDLLKEHGYKEIFVSYDMPFLAKYDCPSRPIERSIDFNESHAHFTKNLPKSKYLQFLRTERVKVHINGVLEENNPMQPALFGRKKGDENFSKRMQPREAFEFLRNEDDSSKIQILAIANYDLSSLLKDVWTFSEQASCHHPDNFLHGIRGNIPMKMVDILTVAEINLSNIDKRKSASPLLDGILASELTTLDMEFYFLAPQFAYQNLQNFRNSYKRFFIIFYDLRLAQHLLASILQHNENIIGLNAVIVDPVNNFRDEQPKVDLRKRNSLKQQISDESLQAELKGMVDAVDDVITGFMIDNGTEIYIFVEGVSHGFILEVWNKIHKSNTSVAKVFLNSETEFDERIYEDFMIVGVYPITLKRQLQKIFREQDLYVQGMIPLPCFKALRKLDLLLQTKTLREMLKQELFPTSNELISLNIEFGVPLKMNV